MNTAGFIHSVETFGTVDGPGTRYVVFLQGCPLRCKFCHNRDTWNRAQGKKVTVRELLLEFNEYQEFYRRTGGGMTASGGEPLMQAGFVSELFHGVKNSGLNTALDTSGYASEREIDSLLEVTDLVLLGLKAVDSQEHKELTGVSNEKIMAFIRHLREVQKPVWLRYVLLPGINDDFNHADRLADFVRSFTNIERLELLGYHKLGAAKWELCGDEDPLKHISPPDQNQVELFRRRLNDLGIKKIY
ncbi:MAG: pyruvate formate-lyase 1-activating enzyme [Firmicutes bacterium HGW-Firmicutes-14]|nr:MAG: pyruvate formate-lyase 1-activating enzyme [Firmicutes bacterium HGW-Firmicutes-14]